MLSPKFKINQSSTDRVFITPEFFCNGHWLVVRKNLNKEGLKMFKPLADKIPGTYYANAFHDASTPDITQVIPKRDGYKPVNPGPTRVIFMEEGTSGTCIDISSYVYSVQDTHEIGINPTYAPLLTLGYAFNKDKTSPIIVLNSNDLNGDLIAVVMPRRI